MDKLNFQALTADNMTAQDIANFRESEVGKTFLGQIGMAVVICITMALLFCGAIVLMAISSNDDTAGSSMAYILPTILGVIGIIIWLSARKDMKNAARLYKFSQQNGLNFIANSKSHSSNLRGLIFNLGHSKTVLRALIFPNNVEMGNYRYTTGSGKNQSTHDWAYVRMKLSRRLPHMVLDAKKNNFWRISNLNTFFDKSQTLQLEGDFNNHFTLYAPNEYKSDALYVFTPDVMQVMIDQGSDYDIEVVDDEIYLYKNGSFKLDDPEFYRSMGRMLSIIHKEILDQTDYYADSRSGDRSQNVIQPAGARLKYSNGWVIIVIVFVLIYFALMFSLWA